MHEKNKNFRQSCIFVCLFIFIGAFIWGQNNYPIILVHGNSGWGRVEDAGRGGDLGGLDYLYWGGEIDIQEELKARGYEVYTATVGPVSSNWDRACELYAQLMGLDYIDYGKAHAEKYGLTNRKVKVNNSRGWERVWKDGHYKEWGGISRDGLNKIHLIGHSQGGQTVRLLAQLLEEGMPSEVEAVLGKNYTNEDVDRAVREGRLSGLFTGRHHNGWVKSVSTFATPNDGTTAADMVNVKDDLMKYFPYFARWTALNRELIDFDLKLDQWGIRRRDGESFRDYLNRAVLKSNLWDYEEEKGTMNFSHYDLSTYGARNMNRWVKDQANIYYFSYSCSVTKQSLGGHVPMMEYADSFFLIPGIAVGRYSKHGIDSSWHENDGLVNTISSNAPKLGRNSANLIDFNYSRRPKKGKWNSFPTLEKTDHEDIIGRSTSEAMGGDLIEFYVRYAEMLRSL